MVKKNGGLKGLLGAQFGKLNDEKVVLTISGLGYKNADGSYNVLDKGTKTITSVPADFVLSDNAPAFVVPATEKDIKAGDLVLHNGFLKFYVEKNDDGTHKVINIKTQEIQQLVPTKTMLGFSAFSKVISLFDGFGSAVGTDGFNMQALLPIMLMGDNDDEDGDGLFGGSGMESLLLMQALGGGTGGLGGLFGGGEGGANNPMQTMMMMKMLKGGL